MPQSASKSGMTKGKMHELSVLLELQEGREENIPVKISVQNKFTNYSFPSDSLMVSIEANLNWGLLGKVKG